MVFTCRLLTKGSSIVNFGLHLLVLPLSILAWVVSVTMERTNGQMLYCSVYWPWLLYFAVYTILAVACHVSMGIVCPGNLKLWMLITIIGGGLEIPCPYIQSLIRLIQIHLVNTDQFCLKYFLRFRKKKCFTKIKWETRDKFTVTFWILFGEI